jgi:REP-associated tyrosine transposase
MYKWHNVSEEERCELLKKRKQRSLPWHSPPHFDSHGLFHLTAANYYHNIIIGKSLERLNYFCEIFLDILSDVGEIKAWVVLPNHYHILISVPDLKDTIRALGRVHGITSREWNKEDNEEGRKCWHRVADRKIRNANHHYATLNYIHHNPVKHNLVKKWNEWHFSSAAQFLKDAGRDQALKIWTQYPLLEYGKGWDEDDFLRL